MKSVVSSFSNAAPSFEAFKGKVKNFFNNERVFNGSEAVSDIVIQQEDKTKPILTFSVKMNQRLVSGTFDFHSNESVVSFIHIRPDAISEITKLNALLRQFNTAA